MAALIDAAASRRLDGATRRPAAQSAPPQPSVWAAARRSHYDALIVGAGFAGSVLAERLASEGQRVLLIDRRPHIGWMRPG